MLRLLIISLLISSCRTIPVRDQYEPPRPEVGKKVYPKYEFVHVHREGMEPLYGLTGAMVRELFVEIQECRTRGQ